MIIFLKWGQEYHPKLGHMFNHGIEHNIYYKDGKDYVYKVFGRKISNIFKFIKTVYRYLDSRNTISCQMPCRLVGMAIDGKYMFPIFKQKKVEPLDKNGEYDLPGNFKDKRPCNFGMYNGRIVAIDVYKYKV